MKYVIKALPLIIIVLCYLAYNSGQFHSTSDNEYIASLAYHGWEEGFFTKKDKPRNPKKAFKHYMVAAKRGSAKSQNMVGAMYANGDSVTQSYEKAAYWWTKAAEQRNDWALNNMGTLYLKGNGVPKDKEKALEFFNKSAALGNKEAEKNLALLNNDTEKISEIVFDEINLRSKRQKQEEEYFRKSAFYKNLESIDQSKGPKALGQEMTEKLKTVNNASIIKTCYLYLEDKLKQADVDDPEYLRLDGLISSLYATLINEGEIKTHDLFAYQESSSRRVFRFYQWLLISFEDEARCKLPLKNLKDQLKLSNDKFNDKYGDYLNKGNAERIKTQVLDLSDRLKNRKPNPEPCNLAESEETQFISDDVWFQRREEIRKEFVERNFNVK